jgi:hypothetical protein
MSHIGDVQLLLQRLKLELPVEPPPKITGAKPPNDSGSVVKIQKMPALICKHFTQVVFGAESLDRGLPFGLAQDTNDLFFAEFVLSHSSAAHSSQQNSPFVTSTFRGSGQTPIQCGGSMRLPPVLIYQKTSETAA